MCSRLLLLVRGLLLRRWSYLKCLFQQVFSESCDELFIVDNDGWVVEVAAFALDLLADLFFLFWFGHVYLDEFERDVVVFEKLFGHFAPYACAESVYDNLVFGFFTWDFGKRHDSSLGKFSLQVNINFFEKCVFVAMIFLVDAGSFGASCSVFVQKAFLELCNCADFTFAA